MEIGVMAVASGFGPADLATALVANLFDQIAAQLLKLLGKGI